MSFLTIIFQRVAFTVFTLQYALIGPAFAQQPTWISLASVLVSPGTAMREVQIPDPPQRITALRLLAHDAGLHVARLVIAYDNGQVHYEERGLQLEVGKPTDLIDGRDEARTVASVTFILATSNVSGRQVRVEIQGRAERLPTPRPPVPVVISKANEKTSGSGTSPPRGTGEQEAKPKEKHIELGVFYGTNRRQEADRIKNGRKLATFSGEASSSLKLGRSLVTIPIERERGSIPRPETNLIIARIALRKEDPNRDFTLAAVDVMSPAEFTQQMGSQITRASRFKEQAFVFVHGYNVAFDDAIFRTAQIAYDVGFDGPAISFSWPSRGGTWDYRHDIDTAKVSRDALLELLETVAKAPGISKVNLVAHSMGSDPVVEMLTQLGEIRRSGGTVKELKLNEIVFAAPDVSRSAFEQFAARFVGIASGGVTLYASRNDRALQASKGIARGIVRAGDVPTSGIVVVPGVDSIDISDASTGFFTTNHSAFADREHLIEDMRLLFARGMRPPHERFAVYRVEGKKPGIWWRYRKN